MESGLGPATAQLGNRQRRFELRLLSLPHRDQAREIVGVPTAIGRRLTNALTYTVKTESIVLLEEPESLGAELLQEEEAEAKAKAEKLRPGLAMFTDGSRLDDGATRYAVVWENGQNRAAYDAECAAIARALETASPRQTTPETVTVFTDAQAAIRRIASEAPGPGQIYALQARKHIPVHRTVEPDIPSRSGGVRRTRVFQGPTSRRKIQTPT